MDTYEKRMGRYYGQHRTADELWKAWLDYCKKDDQPHKDILEWLDHHASPEEVAIILRKAAGLP